MPLPSTFPDEARESEGRRAWFHAATTVALTLLLVVVAVDGLGVVDVFGVDDGTEVAEGGGYELEVTAATVTRPGLATPLHIRVRKEDGFALPVEVAVSTRYLQMFDYQRMYPEPSSERTMGDLTVFELEPPSGDELVVTFDWRLEPAQQSGRSATIAVIEDDRPVVEVETRLRVWP